MSEPPPQSTDLLEAFRLHFHRYNKAVDEAISTPTVEVVLYRLYNDLQEYTALVAEVSCSFPAIQLMPDLVVTVYSCLS